MKSYRWLVILGGVGIVLGLAGAALARKPVVTTAHLADATLVVQHADTPQEQERGLDGWCSLQPDQGMLFNFAHPAQVTFWMKGMRIPIDIVWIRAGRVLGWRTDVQPDGGKQLYPAPGSVDQVVELPAGWVSQHRLQPGDSFED